MNVRKIVIFGLYRHNEFKEYLKLNGDRDNLKLLNRQRILSIKHKAAVKNSLISLSDKVYPGVNKLFTVSNREDGREKWVDFFYNFWHIDCVRKLKFSEFDQEYQEWCERTGYNYSQKKAKEIYESSSDELVSAPADPIIEDIVQAAVNRVNHAIIDVQNFTDKLIMHASEMPEYPVVREMKGVSALLASRLIAELGDVRRFHSRTAIAAYAEVDPGTNKQKSNQTSKKGSTDLRRTLKLIMETLLMNKPEEDEVYKFMDKKRREGKKYCVYTTAGANKFLRIYLAKVKEYLDSVEND